MTQLSIELPVEVQDKVRARATERGFATAQEYVRALIDADTDEDLDHPGGFSTIAELKTLLIEGVESGDSREVTPQEWQQKRQALIERRGRIESV